MVSVIIPTYNEESVISDCLTSLSKQTLKDLEVVVVDDGSTDKTVEVIKNLNLSNFDLQIVNGNHGGAGKARNLGAKKAKGNILVFVDADMTFDKNFLKKLVDPILKGKEKGTFSKDEVVSNWDKPLARAYSINEGWENKKRHPKNYPDEQKVFRAILKSEFDEVGGFTPGGYNDDWSLSEKLGYNAVVVNDAVFFHKNPETLSEIYNHAQWVGKRTYKYGSIGFVVALIRSSLPVSLVVGLVKSFLTAQPMFLIFKVVYDFGLFIGILKYITNRVGSK